MDQGSQRLTQIRSNIVQRSVGLIPSSIIHSINSAIADLVLRERTTIGREKVLDKRASVGRESLYVVVNEAHGLIDNVAPCVIDKNVQGRIQVSWRGRVPRCRTAPIDFILHVLWTIGNRGPQVTSSKGKVSALQAPGIGWFIPVQVNVKGVRRLKKKLPKSRRTRGIL